MRTLAYIQQFGRVQSKVPTRMTQTLQNNQLCRLLRKIQTNGRSIPGGTYEKGKTEANGLMFVSGYLQN
jgi:hypothetical protein